MKRLLVVVTIAAVLVACNTNPKSDVGKISAASLDTAGLSEFQAWKAYQTQSAAAAALVPVQKVSYTPAKTVAKSSAARQRSTTYKRESANTVSSYPAKPAKKGWSKAAKGAAIGAGGGAVLGAVINKRNRAVGAVIGGVVGGGVGYGIGRHMDKKDGRY